MVYTITQFAQAYQCGTYGADAYNETLCDETAPAGHLINTGMSLWGGLVLAVVLIAIPITYYTRAFLRRKTAKRQ